MAVSFRLRRPRWRVIALVLVALLLFLTNPFRRDRAVSPSESPCNLQQGGAEQASQERICKIGDLIQATTVTTTVRMEAQTVTVPRFSRPTQRTRDVFGFPVLSAHDAPLPREVAHTSPNAAHFYREDGLLEVNDEGPHPIFELMEKAEERWKLKKKRASQTLKAACDEYERRYGRLPPQGFNLWWAYVQTYSIPLPDEYDQITKDMAPFWGIEPRRLQKLQHEWEGGANIDTYTVGKENPEDKVSLLNYTTADESKKAEVTNSVPMIVKLFEEVYEFLPSFRATFSPHDGPNLHSDFELVDLAVKAGKENRYIDVDNPPKVKLDGWISACSPTSPAHLNRIDYANPLPPLSHLTQIKHNTSYAYASPSPSSTPPKTFIHDHKTTMDPCLHPAHLHLHGQFLSHERGPVPHRFLYPQFSFSPTTLHHDITVALPYSWVPDVVDPPFDEKEDGRVQWRGSTTGIWYGGAMQWWMTQRPRLNDWANLRARTSAAGERERVLGSPPDARWRVGKPRTLEGKGKGNGGGGMGGGRGKAAWAPAMADVAFAGNPVECSPEVCKERLPKEYEFRQQHSLSTQGRYKYIIDVDGNAWSSRFKRLITSNSLIFKSTIYREWFADRIEPWVHYVPIQLDYSDLLDALYFFRGDPTGHNAHPELAKKIAENGREWSLTHWREVDLTAYMFRLILEYSRVMSEFREDGGLDYIYDEEDEIED